MLKSLLGRIKQITLFAPTRDRRSEEKIRIILQAVAPEPWFLHAERKLRYQYNFTDVVDALHSSNIAVSSHEASASLSTRPCGDAYTLDGKNRTRKRWGDSLQRSEETQSASFPSRP